MLLELAALMLVVDVTIRSDDGPYFRCGGTMFVGEVVCVNKKHVIFQIHVSSVC